MEAELRRQSAFRQSVEKAALKSTGVMTWVGGGPQSLGEVLDRADAKVRRAEFNIGFARRARDDVDALLVDAAAAAAGGKSPRAARMTPR